MRVLAASVNNTDIWTREGAYGTAADPDAVVGWKGVPLDFPRIQGIDIAGEVVEVGHGVDAGWVGRRVIVDPAASYRDGYPDRIVGSEVDGGFAQFHVCSHDQLHDVTGVDVVARHSWRACRPPTAPRSACSTGPDVWRGSGSW